VGAALLIKVLNSGKCHSARKVWRAEPGGGRVGSHNFFSRITDNLFLCHFAVLFNKFTQKTTYVLVFSTLLPSVG
jgi:hypothetical protein